MEDILASIRRIIADEEPAKPDLHEGGGTGVSSGREIGSPGLVASKMSPPVETNEEAPQAGKNAAGAIPFSFAAARRTEKPRLSAFSSVVPNAAGAWRADAPAAADGQVHQPPEFAASHGNGSSGESAAQGSNAASSAAAPSAEDEVFDLTDELIFGELSADSRVDERPAQQAAADKAPAQDTQRPIAAPLHGEGSSKAGPAHEPTPRTVTGWPRNTPLQTPVERAPAASERSSGVFDPAVSPPRLRSSEPQKPAEPLRPLWSRREAPASASPGASNPKASPFSRAAPPQRAPAVPSHDMGATRWTGDFQAQVPSDGPRAPFGDTPEADDEPKREPWPATQQPHEPPAQAQFAAAVHLAQSAVHALRDDELAEAQQVDFSALDRDRKEAVTRSFARAVEPLQSDTLSGSAAGDSDWEQDETPPDMMELEIASQPEGMPASASTSTDAGAPTVGSGLMVPTSRPAPEPVAPQPPAPAVAHPMAAKGNPVATRAISEATFADPAAPAPNAPTRAPTLEDSVREMLRPMLVEWLNEHMPRILEDAIRQEIRLRDLPLGPDKKT